MVNNINPAPGIIYTDGRKKLPNEKMFLILLKGVIVDKTTESEFRDFEWVIGRQEAYEYIRDMIIHTEDTVIDIHESQIISESVNILNGISLYTFMKSFKELVVDDTDFDIEEYNIEEISDNEPEA